MDTKSQVIALQMLIWHFQLIQNSGIACALGAAALINRESSTRWPYRPSIRYTYRRPLGDVWAAEEDGGISDETFRKATRFWKDEVVQLAYELDIPVKFGVDQRGQAHAITESPQEALLIFLWRSAYPLVLHHLSVIFGRSPSWISRVFNGVLLHIWERWGARIEFDAQLMNRERIEKYCAAIAESLESKNEGIFGFIDGTDVPVARPMFEDQQLFYSGHKKHHSINHLAIVLPDGLFGSCFTGYPAAGGDAALCISLGLGEKLRELLSWLPDGQYRYVYGDGAFGSQDFVIGPWKKSAGTVLQPDQKRMNQWLSTKRIVVEHGFGRVKMQFKFLRSLPITGLCPVGIYMPVFAFLVNCQTCLRGGNQISGVFRVSPPSLSEYIEGDLQGLGNSGDEEASPGDAS